MTEPWVAPEPPTLVDGPLTGPDRPILEGFLTWQRHTLLRLCAGLTAEQLVLAAVPTSNLTLLGLVRHLTKVERIWLLERVGGQDLPALFGTDLGKDADLEDLDPARAPEDFARYVEQCRLGDELVASLPLEHAFDLRGETYSLRLVYVHLIAEYSRHNGHGDLIRQAIDGTTGR